MRTRPLNRSAWRGGAVLLIVAALLLAGCTTPPEGDDDAGQDPTDQSGLVEVVEIYDGDVLAAQAGGELQLSPDQLGDIHREFWVAEGTSAIRLDLRTTVADLTLRLAPPGCSVSQACAHVFETERGRGNLSIADPAEGPWMAYLFMHEDQATSAPGLGGIVPGAAEDVPYRLTVTKQQPPHGDMVHEAYEGALVATHAGVIRVSPDQLGDVYREFWVHEGTTELVLDFEASEDVALAVGHSFRARDRFTESIHNTEGSRVSLTIEDPAEGGWYFIVFHHADTGPGVAQVSYTMDIHKDRGGGGAVAAAMTADQV